MGLIHVTLAGCMWPPSALSRQIAWGWRRNWHALFERHLRGMVPTAAGEILAVHAAARWTPSALGEIGGALRAACGSRSAPGATSDAFANELVPRLCVEFQRTHAGVQFQRDRLPTAQVPDAVRSARRHRPMLQPRAAWGHRRGIPPERARCWPCCPWPPTGGRRQRDPGADGRLPAGPAPG